MTIWPTQNWTLVCDYELTIKPTIMIYTSINLEFKTTCQAEALFLITTLKQKWLAIPSLTLRPLGDQQK